MLVVKKKAVGWEASKRILGGKWKHRHLKKTKEDVKEIKDCNLKNKKMHCNADDAFGLSHLPRRPEDVCEHTL